MRTRETSGSVEMVQLMAAASQCYATLKEGVLHMFMDKTGRIIGGMRRTFGSKDRKH